MNGIVLIGFMATGKTAVGKRLAERLSLEFADLDDLIEKKAGMSVGDIFDRYGEPYFRKLESEVLAGISGRRNLVVATGGGVVLEPSNIENLRNIGRLIHLSARPDVILERTRGEHHRPLLRAADPERRIAELLSRRAPFYAGADLEIDTSWLDVDGVVERILRYLEEPSHGHGAC